MAKLVKYSIAVVDWLVELGYTHCFFVPGGNSMHLLDGARTKMQCVPFVHEMSATIAAEYFNETTKDGRAWVLLTAGPGLTHSLSGMAGAFLEGRSLLVLGGQVKTSDLATNGLRQRGIQEINGVAIVAPISKKAIRLEQPISEATFKSVVNLQFGGKPGPVFIELCLDVQGALVQLDNLESEASCQKSNTESKFNALSAAKELISRALENSRRPVLLIGGGVARGVSGLKEKLIEIGAPVMTTYNGADRIGSEFDLYFGRPNTWGMRYSNILLSQADLIVALGTRLGLQQTGFNWQQFAPSARIIQVDIDDLELTKGHPKIEVGFSADATDCLLGIEARLGNGRFDEWVSFCKGVKALLPLNEDVNSQHPGFWNPYHFLEKLSEVSRGADVVIPCSSGGAFTAFFQGFKNKEGQLIVSNKSLASMGYGLAGAIGATIANPDKRVILIEGDGGFSQNLQELATVSVLKPNLKMFLFSNEGYASIRMTQKNYFDGAYLGCDTNTGLGFPDWHTLASAYGIGCSSLSEDDFSSQSFTQLIDSAVPHLFVVKLHPEQTFLPKISSQISEHGGMESEALWDISPKLHPYLAARVFRYSGQIGHSQ